MTSVSDAFVERLIAWGITRIYGYPGDGINGVLGALRRAKDRIEFIQVAHEELASLAATAHAKFTGELGVCLSTGGPGAIHLLNGLFDAKLDHQPVLAIVGQQTLVGIGGSEQQEVDLHPLMKEVAGRYTQMIMKPAQMRHVVDRAVRIARGERVVTCIIMPHDVQREEFEEPGDEHGMQHSSVALSIPHIVPHRDDLERAAEVLNRGERVAILAGAGALDATDEIQQVAEALDAGVAKSLLGLAAVPDDLPYVTGSTGWLGTRASNEMMKSCDTLFMIGSAFPYTEFLPKEGQARGVQIDIRAASLAIRYPMDVALLGDSAETLRALLPLLKKRPRAAWRKKIEQSVREWRGEIERRALAPATPLNPQRVLHAIGDKLPDGCIVTSDSSSPVIWTAHHARFRKGMKFSVSGGLATMGSAIPYALAAKFAFSDRVVIATVGDGAMQMSGNAALIDVAKHWKKWKDPRLAVLVVNNRDLNYVTWEQRVMEGEPRFEDSQELPDFPFAKYAQSLGLGGMKIDDPSQVDAAWTAALGADRPFVIEAWVDANIPTVPPTLEPKQSKHLEQALAQEPEVEPAVREQLERQEIVLEAGS